MLNKKLQINLFAVMLSLFAFFNISPMCMYRTKSHALEMCRQRNVFQQMQLQRQMQLEQERQRRQRLFQQSLLFNSQTAVPMYKQKKKKEKQHQRARVLNLFEDPEENEDPTALKIARWREKKRRLIEKAEKLKKTKANSTTPRKKSTLQKKSVKRPTFTTETTIPSIRIRHEQSRNTFKGRRPPPGNHGTFHSSRNSIMLLVGTTMVATCSFILYKCWKKRVAKTEKKKKVTKKSQNFFTRIKSSF